MTDSRKNSATALFGLNIDNLTKLASDLPYSIMTVNIEYIIIIIIIIIALIIMGIYYMLFLQSPRST